jgi:molybdopterin-dependent oxidoreductase alpha subunit
MTDRPRIIAYEDPAGGWGSVTGMAKVLSRTGSMASSALTMTRQNKTGGYACVSCAWPKPAKPAPFEFCENGAKATAWEMMARRATPALFARHSVAEMLTWTDLELESAGRLTEPLRWDEASDRYLPVAWSEAFADIGAHLQGMQPEQVVFYASGRASLETSYMYALFARLYGCNNLPDSSNMCHESTSVALPDSIGVTVGTVRLEDFEHADCLMFFGHNTGSNSPRMLNQLQAASKRGVPIIVFNPLRERGLERFKSPQHIDEMLSPAATRISTQYHQLRTGGDIAAMTGICKALLEMDARDGTVLDHAFLAEHTHGLQAFAAAVRGYDWDAIEHASGLSRAVLTDVAAIYATSKATMAIYGMGLTQHANGVENVQMLVNLLLLRGNIGRPGAGICPVRGHSNVQGQRTVGITEKPELVPNDRLRELYFFDPPMTHGLNTVEACAQILNGNISAFIGLGGNFIRAIPETASMEAAWARIPLTVQIATTLNRNHLIHGQVSYVLPCLGRIERDVQATGPQAVSVEDSTACIHGSLGKRTPVSPHLLSEPAIVAGLAKATLPPNRHVDWDGWVADYAKIRDAIEATYPDQFRDMNARLWTPGGFPRPVKARIREWATKTGRANFMMPAALIEPAVLRHRAAGVLQLMTVRSNDQFNTTIYGYDDRFRGIAGTRHVVMMNRHDIARLGLTDGGLCTLSTVTDDGIQRRVTGLRVTAYDVPAGCCAAYYPECNPLIPLWHHARGSQVPAAKSVPVEVLPG